MSSTVELERERAQVDRDPLVHLVCCLEPDRSFCGTEVSGPADAAQPGVVCRVLRPVGDPSVLPVRPRLHPEPGSAMTTNERSNGERGHVTEREQACGHCASTDRDDVGLIHKR